jgi:metallo-beta-lactamase family protein
MPPAPESDAALSLRFHGAAGEVTGSCCEVALRAVRFLVDCGMFQGGRDADERNEHALAFAQGLPSFVLLTHAHIDHSGLLPRLTARGFHGPIHATPPTCDLLRVMLLDSANIQEKEAQWRERRGQDVPPLYTVAEARRSLELLQPHPYGKAFEPAPGMRVRFLDAGHILGSAIVEIAWGGRTIVFSGDLGQPGRPVLADPTKVAHADLLVVESTYGNRLHKTLEQTMQEFTEVLRTTLPRGNVVIPAFAVGRTQELLHVLADLARRDPLPPLNVFVDSPLATAATEVHARYADVLDRETRDLAAWQRAHPERIRVRFTESPEESMALNGVRSGAVILAASGMCEAGRIRHHLRHNLPRENSAVVFTGFQAAGTLGRAIVDGARRVHLFREEVPVRASVHTIGGLSAHADQGALLDWLSAFGHPPARTFVVHGEAEIADGFVQIIRRRFGWTSVEVPARGERYTID